MARNRVVGPIPFAAALLLSGSARAAPTFTVVTRPSGVQALRDSKPMDWWLSGLTFVDFALILAFSGVRRRSRTSRPAPAPTEVR